MFARLTGTIVDISDHTVVLDVNGVGYLVAVSGRTRASLVVGEAARLVIETVVREDAINLYGFMDEGEQAWFRLLTSVQGVGPRVGMALLSALHPDELVMAIAVGDHASLSRADGVGNKLATRIASELKDKVPETMVLTAPKRAVMPAAANKPGNVANHMPSRATTPETDAVSALVNLGYGRSEAFAVVMRVRDECPPEVGAIVTRALQELMKGAA
jgi:Holliday junction DNA helicase RuvA